MRTCKEILRAFPAGALFPPHGSRVWVHCGITAHSHSSTVQNRPGTPFRYAAVHEPHTESWGSVDKVLVQPRALVLVYTPVLVYTSIVLAVEVLYGDGSIVLRPGTQYIVLHSILVTIYKLYTRSILAGGDELLSGQYELNIAIHGSLRVYFVLSA